MNNASHEMSRSDLDAKYRCMLHRSGNMHWLQGAKCPRV